MSDIREFSKGGVWGVGKSGKPLAIEVDVFNVTTRLNNALLFDDAAITGFSGDADTAGPDVYVETKDGGAGATAGKAGGLYNLKTGDGSDGATGVGNAGADGGAITLTTGDGGDVGTVASGTADGGDAADMTIAGGDGGGGGDSSGTDGNGANVILASGSAGSGGNSAGKNGNVISRGQTFMQKKLDDPIGAAATISTAELLGGIIVATPTGDGDAYTTPTGAQISALFGVTPVVGDSFELTIINIAGTNKTVELTAGATGMTIIGEATIENVTDGVAAGVASSGTFIFVNTVANVWKAYRK